MEKKYIVTSAQAGQRLDKVLAELLPTASLRMRRRLCQEGLALVNGGVRAPGYSLREGSEILIRELDIVPLAVDTPTPTSSDAADLDTTALDQPRLLSNPSPENGLHFLYKPAGWHSTALAGSKSLSIEALLPRLLPEKASLLNRLDCGTSGLLLAAATEEAADIWADWERKGQCRKLYLALLTGHLPVTLTMKEALDTDQRKITRVLAEEAPALRHTRITPLGHWHSDDAAAVMPPTFLPPTADTESTPLTLALCEIRKGARHQIRAHAAYAGHPLWGDLRYATPTSATEPSPLVVASLRAQGTESGDGHFFLHHAQLQFPEFVMSAPCPWLSHLPEKIANNITQCLNENKILP